MSKKNRMITLILSPLLLVVACAKADRSEADRGGVFVNLPVGMNNSYADVKLGKETSIVISVTSAGLVYLNKKVVPKDTWSQEIKHLAEGREAENQIVYVRGDVDVGYGDFNEVLKAIRAAGIDTVGLVVKNTASSSTQYQLEIRLPSKPDPESNVSTVATVPDPSLLVVDIGADGILKLNAEDMGTIGDPGPLSAKLAEVLKTRAAFSSDMFPAQKTVFINSPKTMKYGDVVKIVNAVAGAGGKPIGLQVDDPIPVAPRPSVKPVEGGVIGGEPVIKP